MSDFKNSLFEDLDMKNREDINELVDKTKPQQLISQEEMSQIKKRQLALKKEPQVQALAEKIDIKDQIAVLEFGSETATAISSFSDRMLATIKTSKLEKSSALINNLNKIMDRFDPQDFKEEKKQVF